ncbi:hypothetical protein [Sinorhizobium meliloti]|uniref:hypothetical protein n=1 Tax=Rhizobium meliloti TaxID=382 RepID=UPI003DA127BE
MYDERDFIASCMSRTKQGGDVLQAHEWVAMLRLHKLGWVANVYRFDLHLVARLRFEADGRPLLCL